MKYLKKFENHSQYESYIATDYAKPNVSYCEDNNDVHYNPLVNETKLVVYYDIQDISAPTTIFTNYGSNVKSIEVDGVLLDSVVTTYQFDSVGEHVIKYEFNNSTVGNGSPLFNNITTIKRAVIADTFTSISNYAFYYCSGLTNVTIGNGVTNIGASAFASCNGLTSITIPNSVTSIGDAAFEYCSGLTTANINSSEIGYKAFSNCSGLTSVTIGNSITSISNYAFYNCSSLASVTIPNGVTSIGHNAFEDCSGLTSVVIPNSVTSIDASAFADCGSLASVIIGNSVTSIGTHVFANCGLTSITSLATTAPTIQDNTFYNIKTGGTLYVPQGSTGYDVWMQNANYYLGKFGWTKVEQ